jgi:ABC-type antimicrobial peptide transport system permease subunit
VGAGIVAGLLVSTTLGPVLSNQLYDTPARDPLAFLGSIAVLFVVAMLAHVVPLRRATSVEPAVSLRNE